MKLGGWFRLGIVISVIYGILVGIFCYERFPNKEELQYNWFSEASEVIAESISKATNTAVQPYEVRQELLKYDDAKNIIWLEKVASSPTENQKKFSADIANVNKKNKAIIASLPQRQLEHMLLSFAWWFGGTLLLFALGWTVRWVYRGFTS